MNFGSKAMRLFFFLIQCVKKNYSWEGLHYRTENVEFVNLSEGFQVLREKKKCDDIYVSVVMAFSWHFVSNTLKYCTAQKYVITLS